MELSAKIPSTAAVGTLYGGQVVIAVRFSVDVPAAVAIGALHCRKAAGAVRLAVLPPHTYWEVGSIKHSRVSLKITSLVPLNCDAIGLKLEGNTVDRKPLQLLLEYEKREVIVN